MHTEILSVHSPNAIQHANAVLQAGGLIAFPTDTVYGLAVPVFDEDGIHKLYHAKKRPVEKAIPVLIGSINHLERIVLALPEAAGKLIGAFWPGPLTIVVPKHPRLPSSLSLYPTVGIRMPDCVFTLQLLIETGPLATTSANLSGQDNPLTAGEVFDQLGGRIDLILDGGPTSGSMPSSVVDFSQTPPAVLREGSLPASLLLEVMAASRGGTPFR